MKENRNRQATKYGKKETMEGQEFSMSFPSDMHCLGLPSAGTCSLLLSLNKQCSKSAAQTAGTTKRVKSIDPYAAKMWAKGQTLHHHLHNLGRACTSLHPLRYDDQDEVARKAGLYGICATARLRQHDLRDTSIDKPPVSGHIVPNS